MEDAWPSTQACSSTAVAVNGKHFSVFFSVVVDTFCLAETDNSGVWCVDKVERESVLICDSSGQKCWEAVHCLCQHQATSLNLIISNNTNFTMCIF